MNRGHENSDNSNLATCVVCGKVYECSQLEMDRQRQGLDESLCPYHYAMKYGEHDYPTQQEDIDEDKRHNI